jgi:hypothetical protein
VFGVQLQRDLFQAVDDQTESVLFGLGADEQVDFFNQNFGGWSFEMCVEEVGESICVVGDDFNLEL